MKTFSFKMSHSAFSRTIVTISGKPYIISLGILTILGVIIGIYVDIRYLILALIIVFIISPAVLSILYYSEGLKRISCLNVVNHSLVYDEDSVAIETYDDEDFPIRKVVIPYDKLGKMIIGSESVTFMLKERNDGFLWVPISAFENSWEFSEFFNALISKR